MMSPRPMPRASRRGRGRLRGDTQRAQHGQECRSDRSPRRKPDASDRPPSSCGRALSHRPTRRRPRRSAMEKAKALARAPVAASVTSSDRRSLSRPSVAGMESRSARGPGSSRVRGCLPAVAPGRPHPTGSSRCSAPTARRRAQRGRWWCWSRRIRPRTHARASTDARLREQAACDVFRCAGLPRSRRVQVHPMRTPRRP